MARFAKPAEGSWTEHYPELGTEPVSYEDSISPEFYELEREAIFKRAWLNVGRVEQLPRNGSYFTKELAVANTSIVVVRGMDGEVRAFHNICRHRGNKLVWNDYPREETSGTCRQFVCKYHGWRYDLDGACAFVQQEDEFFDLDKADYGLVPVHCDVWAGLHLREPRRRSRAQSLREFLGPMVTALEGYPFDQHDASASRTARRSTRTGSCSWTRSQEFYHAPVLHARQSPVACAAPSARPGFEAPHYRHRRSAPPREHVGRADWEMPPDELKPMERSTRSGLFGPWDKPDLGEMPAGLNPAAASLGTRLVPDLPELRDPDLGPGLVPHVPLLADVVQHAHVRGEPLLPARRRPRVSASRRRWRR